MNGIVFLVLLVFVAAVLYGIGAIGPFAGIAAAVGWIVAVVALLIFLYLLRSGSRRSTSTRSHHGGH
jgi:hypothetical protein